ncbi:polysaccharide biosynthesis/export family protein [Marivivens sp. LCG002]|uniref:polysaccharide biosynthesis/export family protein n=1 Tax=Marivivens sp. LCG002 TaxID=3051171 RepID=UPI002552FB74|nr:polysaccharide biosynthesis/export family protein [Marivivens sp. LCG002]WIV51422.1 polysaccharide biosynthesis/export family protein [Marivivens sp. LCG002]
MRIRPLLLSTAALTFLTACAYLPQNIVAPTTEAAAAQTSFDLDVQAVTASVISQANSRKWERGFVVADSGSAALASVVPASVALSERYPVATGKVAYTLGAGDVLIFTETRNSIASDGVSGLIANTERLVVSNGNTIVSPVFGVLDVSGKTVEQVRSEISERLRQRAGKSNAVSILPKPPVGIRPIYRIGAGDEIAITTVSSEVSTNGVSQTLIETPTTREIRVSSQGSISLLGVGEVFIEGMTRSEASRAIADALTGAGLDPKNEIVIKRNVANPARLIGDVPVQRTIEILEAPIDLANVLSEYGVRPTDEREFQVKLLRNGIEYGILASEILGSADTARIYIQSGDTISVEAISKNTSFDLYVEGYNSQKVSVISSSASARNAVLPITEQGITLVDALLNAGLIVTPDSEYLIRLTRRGTEYRMSAQKVLVEHPGASIYLRGGDKIVIEPLEYSKQTVMVTGAGTSPKLIEISPTTRPTLATAIFSSAALGNIEADLKQVFLLRRKEQVANSFDAYFIDLSDPTRLILAKELQLRPDDIIFVSTQPISEFSSVISRINGALTNGLGTLAIAGFK